MKHVLIVNHNAGSIYHGPNFRSYYVGRTLVAQGFRVTIACSSFSHKLTRFPVVEGNYKEDCIDGVRMIWLKMPSYHSSIGRLWNYLHFARGLRTLKDVVPESVDIVICSSPPPYWIWNCLRLARAYNARLIFECRDLWPDVVTETMKTAYLNPAVWLMIIAERVAYRSADAVVAVNKEAQPIMEERGLVPGKFYAIPNGVVLEKAMDRQELDPRIKERLPKGRPLCVGYAGSISKVYGLEYLVDAAKTMVNENIHFVLAGVGRDESKLREQAANLRNVSFVGWVPKEQLCAFLQYVDIAYAGLLNIRAFTHGSDSTKVYEYMKAGKPVVHALGANTSIVTDAGAGLHIRPESGKAITDAIRKMRKLSKVELDRMGNSGFEYIKKNRTYEALGNKWVELLNS